MTPLPPDDELERLRRELRELDDQVKLLVQAEQRLFRSQADLDSQLARIRALAAFALDSGGAQSVTNVLERALGVLSGAYMLDWAGAVRVNPDADQVRLLCSIPADPGRHEFAAIDGETASWLRGLTSAVMFGTASELAESPALRLLGLVWPEAPAPGPVPGAKLVCIPMHSSDGTVQGALLAWSNSKRRFYARHLAFDQRENPFLDLLGRHTERAVENAILTDRLRQRSIELAASVASLETAQEALVQAQKMEAIGRLAGGVAHDFNNLLTVILGYAESLQESIAPGTPERYNVQQVLEAGRRAAEITAQLLAFGRRQIQRREAIDLPELVRRTTELLGRLVGENIRIELELEHAASLALADRSQIEQVLLNLVVNARDAMPHGGRMVVGVRRARLEDVTRLDIPVDPANFVALEVSDQGTGMDESTRARIFEPFFTTKDQARGTGLGLAVVYGVAKQSEGHVYVDSEPGRGSRFVVLLPRTSAPRTVAADALPRPCYEGAGRVLLVEDEDLIREFISSTLRSAGHEVYPARDAESALDVVASLEISLDLLVTDVLMPGLSGVKLAELLRMRQPGLQVLFISGYSRELLDSHRAGIADAAFLAKPMSAELLLGRVHELLRPLVGTRAATPASGSGRPA